MNSDQLSAAHVQMACAIICLAAGQLKTLELAASRQSVDHGM